MYSDEYLILLRECGEKTRMDAAPALACDEKAFAQAVSRFYDLPTPGLTRRFPNYQVPVIWCDGPFEMFAIPMLLQLLIYDIKQRGVGIEDAQSSREELLDCLVDERWRRASHRIHDQLSDKQLLQLAALPLPKKDEIEFHAGYSWSALGIPFACVLDPYLRPAISGSYDLLFGPFAGSPKSQAAIELDRVREDNKRVMISSMELENGLDLSILDSVHADYYIDDSRSWSRPMAQALSEQLTATHFEAIADHINVPAMPPFQMLKSQVELTSFAKRLSYMMFGGLLTSVWGCWRRENIFRYAAPRLSPGSLDPSYEQILNDLTVLCENSFAYIPLSRVFFACKHPTKAALDDQRRLHCTDGPCIQFADGTGAFAMQGIPVGSNWILHPERLSALEIDATPNIEQRRVLIDLFGTARYIQESGAEIIDQDDVGILYRKRMTRDEAIVMVRVKNSTPEPDGTFREYFLRVPPTMRTAREAVAWTFSMESHEYRPEKQT